MTNPTEKELKSLRIQAYSDGKTSGRVNVTMKLYQVSTAIEQAETELKQVLTRKDELEFSLTRLKASAAGYQQALSQLK